MASDHTGDQDGAAGRPLRPVPTAPDVEADEGPELPPPVGGEVTSPWLARRPGEDTNEQMARIRRTCRWCGDEYRAVERIELARHERAHAAKEMTTDELPGLP